MGVAVTDDMSVLRCLREGAAECVTVVGFGFIAVAAGRGERGRDNCACRLFTDCPARLCARPLDHQICPLERTCKT